MFVIFSCFFVLFCFFLRFFSFFVFLILLAFPFIFCETVLQIRAGHKSNVERTVGRDTGQPTKVFRVCKVSSCDPKSRK